MRQVAFASINWMAVLPILFFISACSGVPTVPNESLNHFTESVTSLKTDTEKSFEGITATSEARFKSTLIEEMADGDTYSLEKLAVETDFKTLSVTKVPYFLKLQKLKSEVSRLNTAMVDYVSLLTHLANPDTISTETFDTLANSLNANVLTAMPSIDSESGKKNAGLFSATAMSLTENYLKSKQSELLVNAVRNNQPSVERFSAHLQRGVVLIARAVSLEYEREAAAMKVAAAKAQDRSTIIQQLIDRNKQHFTDIQTLKRLHTNYGRLSLLHASIADAIHAGNKKLPRVVRMLEATSRLNKEFQKTLSPEPAANPTDPSAVPEVVSQ